MEVTRFDSSQLHSQRSVCYPLPMALTRSDWATLGTVAAAAAGIIWGAAQLASTVDHLGEDVQALEAEIGQLRDAHAHDQGEEFEALNLLFERWALITESPP